jgi:hypothetical protein
MSLPLTCFLLSNCRLPRDFKLLGIVVHPDQSRWGLKWIVQPRPQIAIEEQLLPQQSSQRRTPVFCPVEHAHRQIDDASIQAHQLVLEAELLPPAFTLRDYKGKNADRLVTRIDPGVVSLVAELRGHERQAAEELGRWKTGGEE